MAAIDQGETMSQHPHMPPPHPGHQYQAGPLSAPRKPGLGKTIFICAAAGCGGLIVLGVIASALGAGDTGTKGTAAAPTTSATTSAVPERQSATKPSASMPAAPKPSKAPKPVTGV